MITSALVIAAAHSVRRGRPGQLALGNYRSDLLIAQRGSASTNNVGSCRTANSACSVAPRSAKCTSCASTSRRGTPLPGAATSLTVTGGSRAMVRCALRKLAVQPARTRRHNDHEDDQQHQKNVDQRSDIDFCGGMGTVESAMGHLHKARVEGRSVRRARPGLLLTLDTGRGGLCAGPVVRNANLRDIFVWAGRTLAAKKTPRLRLRSRGARCLRRSRGLVAGFNLRRDDADVGNVRLVAEANHLRRRCQSPCPCHPSRTSPSPAASRKSSVSSGAMSAFW